MTNRITKKMAENQFERLCKALGKRIATTYNDVGAWQLDDNSGLTILEVANERGGVSTPFNSDRLSYKDFYDQVNFALRAIQLDRSPESVFYWPKAKS